MLPDTVSRRLEALGNISKNGKRINGLFRLMEEPALWLQAYANLYSNDGAVTPGVGEVTMDGFSPDRAANIIELLKEGRYRFKPSRRGYVPKANGKERPLGMPSGDDKLVQEVARMLLEQIYEPIFSDWSHGFRAKRSCHTALTKIRRTWTGMKWLVEVDIQSFFDTINHDKLIEVLEKHIDDKRFINLVKAMLQAGYAEDWIFHGTYSGTPQGGVLSPLLANIYLHGLDMYMEGMRRQFDRGKERAPSREYTILTNRIYRLRRNIEQARMEGDAASPGILVMQERIQQYIQARNKLSSGTPQDNGYRRLLYCRYADDFVIGIIGSHDDAKRIMEQVRSFIQTELHLNIAEEKSGIHHAKEGVTFLGYEMRTYTDDRVRRIKRGSLHHTARTVSENMQLHVPIKKVMEFGRKHGYGNYGELKATHKPEWLSRSDAEIILAYNAELRGLANYYCLAYRVKKRLGKLTYLWLGSLLKTLASKHRMTVRQTAQKLRQGTDFVHRYEVQGRPKRLKVFSMKELKVVPQSWSSVDIMPNVNLWTMGRTELIARLNAGRCEYCGQEKGYFAVHHVRKLRDVADGKELWQRVMAAMQRKTLVLCIHCHQELHAGRLPDWRARLMKVESRMS
jgi:group II intron reverse transcriptase/maturase